jgi:hypothetical protein
MRGEVLAVRGEKLGVRGEELGVRGQGLEGGVKRSIRNPLRLTPNPNPEIRSRVRQYRDLASFVVA